MRPSVWQRSRLPRKQMTWMASPWCADAHGAVCLRITVLSKTCFLYFPDRQHAQSIRPHFFFFLHRTQVSSQSQASFGRRCLLLQTVCLFGCLARKQHYRTHHPQQREFNLNVADDEPCKRGRGGGAKLNFMKGASRYCGFLCSQAAYLKVITPQPKIRSDSSTRESM